MKYLIRKNIQELNGYRVKTPEYDIVINANESPYDLPAEVKEEAFEIIRNTNLNRYPDAYFPELRVELGKYCNVDPDQIICGCGSDEIITMLNQAFVNAGDVVVSHTPSFAMYDISASVANAIHITVPDFGDYQIDVDDMIRIANANQAKLLYLCYPNNPTGYALSTDDIIRVLESTNCIVVLDEAYYEFNGVTGVDLLDNYPRLIVLRTMSKAFGLAGTRCGYAIANQELIDVLYKVKQPYNLNVLTQIMAVTALKNKEKILANVSKITRERERVYKELLKIKDIKVYYSLSNYLFIETLKGDKIYNALLESGILIKYFKGGDDIPHRIRFTIGTPEENDQVLKIMKEV
jgi:histidinol-phosphate aminotransferase